MQYFCLKAPLCNMYTHRPNTKFSVEIHTKKLIVVIGQDNTSSPFHGDWLKDDF